MTLTEVIQKVQLVEGNFSPSEASDIISSLIDVKVNFHKLQRLSWREGNENCNTRYPDGRIAELENERKVAKEFLQSARSERCSVKITGTLEISFED